MIQEGFFSNVGASPYDGLRRAFTKAINGSVYFERESSLRKYVPGARVRIDDKNILTLYSSVYPDISYEFDLTEVFNEILKGLKSEPSININKINWDAFGVLYSEHANSVIQIVIRVSKGKMQLKINGATGYGGYMSLYCNGPRIETVYKLNKKFEYELDVVQSAVAICMNLRTSLTKYIKGLSDGAMKAIDVKKDIENYIKDLK